MKGKNFYYLTHWESWHWLIKYILVAPVWTWYCLRAKSFWFFSSSNPSLTFGGFTGETKSEIYKQLPEGSFPKSIYLSPDLSFQDVENQVLENHLSFPLAAKPDMGMMGFMFRKIETLQQLRQYHAAIPTDYILQKFVDYPLEVSVFYYRYPNEQKGHISGFVKKECLQVRGDGKKSLKKLILSYPRAQFRLKELFSKHENKLSTILKVGEIFYLSDALNLSRGGQLVSLEHEKNEQLLSVFDNLSHFTKKFFYGRYDIKCKSIEDLKQGKNFSILEFNGSGAEPHHIYGNSNTLFTACKVLVQHWNVLFKISRYNHNLGIYYWRHTHGMKFIKNASIYFKKLKQLDSTFQFDPVVKKARQTVPLSPAPELFVQHSLPQTHAA